MRIGILGGAFDPIHLGHVQTAEAALTALKLDRVLMLPSGEPPYKRLRASREQRMAMVKLACAGRPGLVPCDLEVNRPGPTYAADTLRALKALYPQDALIYLLGADALATLHRWRGVQDIVGLCAFAALGRPGAGSPIVFPEGAQVLWPGIEGPDISSGIVRERVARNLPIGDVTPRPVADYIREQGLYLCDFTESELHARLQKTITLHRYHHTLGVADTARQLAPRCGVDPQRARLAGLLHDCAKSLPYGEMVRLVRTFVPDTDPLELDAEPVLHAPAGMVLARRDYGLRDECLLQAIRRHTLGGPGMTAMDALIYVSDFIEPGRRSFPGLEAVRAAAETDIFQALLMSAKLSGDYLISRGQTPHPRTTAMIAELRASLNPSPND